MKLYFSVTGNSLAVARQVAEKLNESIVSLHEAVRRDLTQEKRIGLVFPTYDFNIPPAVCQLVKQLRISADAYVFVIITCGGQVGNSIWKLRRLLQKQGIELAYSHKVRVPDNSAIAFGRNPNDQMWKFKHVDGRIEQIVADVQAKCHELHYSWWSFIAWIMGLKKMEEGMLRTLRPHVNEERCVGCETCVRVCPMRNIVMTEHEDNHSLAAIGPHCTVCFACLHFCPHQAVQVGKRLTIKEHQYHHPKVKLKDLLCR